jgi:short-subunit dehydrogenase
MALALITGGSSGLGVDFAHILAELKYDLILVARSEQKMQAIAQKLSKEHGVRCFVIAKDLSKPGSAAELFQAIESSDDYHSVDILINNAGYGQWGAFGQSDFDSLTTMLQLNMNTLAELMRLFLPQMISRGHGQILNVASTAAFQPGPWMAAYYASKSFVLSLGEAVSTELKGTGVTITTLCPGPTKTEFFERANIGNSRLKSLFMADSMTCARRGVKAMLAGNTVVIDGWLNFIFSQTARLMPRAIVRTITGKINAAVK